MPDADIEQQLLVARLRLGDEQALGPLVRHYAPRLLWFVRNLGLSEAAAEDVVQEAWVTAWASIHRLNDVRRFRAWLYGIARNKALQQAGIARELPMAEFDPAADEPDESFFERYLPHLNQAMERLTIHHREVLALRFLEGMSYEALAETIGVAVGTVKSRLHNAKQALRRQLEVIADD